MWSYEQQNKTVLFDYTIPYLVKQTRLVIEFKNGCLKRCENCSLKSVIEIHVFSVYKTKKMCLVSWFKLHVSVFKNIKYVFGMCVLDGKKKAEQSIK